MGGLTRPRPRGCRPPARLGLGLVAAPGTGLDRPAEAHLALQDGDLLDLAADLLLEFGVDRLVGGGDRVLAKFLGGDVLLVSGLRRLVAEVEFVEQGSALLLRAPLRDFALEPRLGIAGPGPRARVSSAGWRVLGSVPGRSPSRRRPRRRRRRRGPSSLPTEAAVSSAALSVSSSASRFELGSEIRPAGGGKIGAGPGVGLARTLAARDVARLTRAVVGACRPLAGRLPVPVPRPRSGSRRRSRGRSGSAVRTRSASGSGSELGRVGPSAEAFGSRLAGPFGDDLALAAA